MREEDEGRVIIVEEIIVLNEGSSEVGEEDV